MQDEVTVWYEAVWMAIWSIMIKIPSMTHLEGGKSPHNIWEYWKLRGERREREMKKKIVCILYVSS